MKTHRGALLVLAAGLCVGVTGCGWISPWGTVCPAIGYVSQVRVLLTGDVASVTEVVLCDAAGECSVVESEWAEVADAPLRVITPDELGPDELGVEPTVPAESDQLRAEAIEPDQIGVEPIDPNPSDPHQVGSGPSDPNQLGTEPAVPPPVEIPPYLARADGRSAWAITVMGELPKDVTVTAYRADESIAGESTAVLVWERVGGSEQCGGPMEAEPVIVAVS